MSMTLLSCKNSKSMDSPSQSIETNLIETDTSGQEVSDKNQVRPIADSQHEENIDSKKNNGDGNINNRSTRSQALPKGFIIDDNVTMYSEPDKKSAKVTSLKKGGEIYLIETMLAEENGVLSSYPAWYHIETSDGHTGWVEASKVSFGH